MSRRIPSLALFLALAVTSPARGTITPANVARLALKWEVPASQSVTGAIVVANGLVYTTSWDGNVRALDPDTGAQRWVFNVGPTSVIGGVLVTPQGHVCFGTGLADVFCLRGDDGTLVWKRDDLRLPTTDGTPTHDVVWSQLATANGRLFVGIASVSDNPCTHGRLIALDLATGATLWTFKTVPDRVCNHDTGISCTTADDCISVGGDCVEGLGAGVTATVNFDPTGEFVYMNTVGCYTFPSIGDSDSILKLEATTGHVVWRQRVTAAEQFGFCALDSSVDCGTDAQCTIEEVGGTCTVPKVVYHDFGFLNGPLRIPDVDTALGRETLIISGSKDGTLYARRETTGDPIWHREVVPVPVTPGFAAYGLFNGALAYADGTIYAALNATAPARVCDNDHSVGCSSDAACGTGHCMPEPKHLMAFDVTTGATVWSDEIGRSWSSVAVANGVVYAGTQVKDETTGASTFFAYDAANGTRLASFALPAPSVARAAVAGDTLFVGYGVFSNGGVRAYSLCGNGMIDPGEECDPATPGTFGCCTPTCRLVADGTACSDGTACTDGDTCRSALCIATPHDCSSAGDQCNDGVCDATSQACVARPKGAGLACDDGDACTSGDQCDGAGRCGGSAPSVDAVTCELARIVDRPCGDTPVPGPLLKPVKKRLKAAGHLVARAANLGARGKTAKAEQLRSSASTTLAGIPALTAKAVASQQAKRHITPACKQAMDALVDRSRGVLTTLAF